MRFTTKAGDIEVQSGNYLRNLKTGETRVRFLFEETDWDSFYEHYTADNKSFPCLGLEHKDICPGCTSDNERVSKASRKYATNLYLVKQKVVLPFRLPYAIYEKMETRRQRADNKSLLTRDYVLIRSGSGLETSYDVDNEDAYELDIAALRKDGAEVGEILLESFTKLFGDPDEYVRTHGASAVTSPKAPPATKETTPDPQPEEITLTEAEVRAMNLVELNNLAAKMNKDITACENRDQIIAVILDEPPY